VSLEAAPPAGGAPAEPAPRPAEPPPPHYWRVAPVSAALLALIVAVHLLVEASGGSEDQWTLLRFGANLRLATLHGEPWRMLSSMFLHGGNLHLAVNAYALYSLGRLVEQLTGSLRFFVVYMVAGLAGSASSALIGDPYRLSVGASGAIFGLLGAAIVLIVRLRAVLPPAWRKHVTINLLIVLGLNLYIGFKVAMVDNAAHIGGLAGGALATLVVAWRHPALSGPLGGRVWGARRLTLALAALLLVAGVATATLVALTPQARTLARLPRQRVERAGIEAVCPRHWILATGVRPVLRDPLVRMMIVELDVDAPTAPVPAAQYLSERAEGELRALHEEKEVQRSRRLPAPTVRLGVPGVDEVEYELQLRGQLFRQLLLVRRQGDLYVLARVLASAGRLVDYRDVLGELATSMRYNGGP
jgi:membrane associated rhomboid family serine protease